MTPSPHIKLLERGSAGVIQLNRPESLNAITFEMFRDLYQILRQWEANKDIVIFKGSGKVFCAGGDMKQFVTQAKTAEDMKNACLNACRAYDLIQNYQKPFVALVDGLAMGGAAIYATPGRFRVATERTAFAMPEMAIGFFNDAGSSYFLSRLENHFGFYIGMTGTRVKGFDMKKVGLATHFIESSKLDEVEENLNGCRTNEDVERTLNKFSSDPLNTDTELDLILPRVEKCFSGSTVEEILENLDKDGSDWAKKTLKILSKMSPTSLKVTHRSMTRGKHLPLRECLRMEFRLAHNFIVNESDMKEGIRSVLIDKDFKPKWNPNVVEEVSEERVEKFFEPTIYDHELTFEDHFLNKL